MATAAATHSPLTRAESAAVARMTDAAARRQLTVFGPSSYVVPEADPNTPVWCVSSQRRNGAWHLVWVQTVADPRGPTQRLMCSCPARQRADVFTCSHAQAVRLQLSSELAAQYAARGARPASYVESPVSVPASPPAPPIRPSGPCETPGTCGHGLGSAEAFDRRFAAYLAELQRMPDITFTPAGANDPDIAACVPPGVPSDAVESLNAWHDARDAETRAAHDADDPGPDPDPDDDDPDPDPLPRAAAAAAPVPERTPCPSCGQLANPDDVREIGSCLDCVLLSEAAEIEQPAAESAEQPDQPDQPAEPDPPATRVPFVHCPRCGREADPDAVAEHGACARCIHARPELSQSAKRTPEQKAEIRRRIIAAETARQRHYRRQSDKGRDDDPRREEQRRERTEKAEARRRERRESDGNPRADHETAILYRDNRPISPFRETRAPYTTTRPQPDDPRYLGSNDIGQRFYAVGEHQTIFTIHHELHPDHPGRQFFYCTWACWLTRGHELAGVTIDPATGAITGIATESTTTTPNPTTSADPRALEFRLLRLGGDFERARLDRDYDHAISAGDEIARIGAQMPEIYAWWLTVIRGRNAIRRARGLEPVHY